MKNSRLYTELRKSFEQAQQSYARRNDFPGQLGDGAGNVDVKGPDEVPIPGMAWARVDMGSGDGIAPTRIRCTKVQPINNLYVRVRYNHEGNLEAYDIDDVLAMAFTNGRNPNVGAHAWQHRGVHVTDPLFVEGINIVPLACWPTYPRDLTVTIQPYAYRYGGQWKFYPGGTVDLSSYLPTTPAGVQAMVVLSLNPSTNAIVVTEAEGEEVPFVPGSYTIPFTYEQAASVDVGDLMRIAAVRLYEGQETIEWIDIIYDLRAHVGGGGGGLGLDIGSEGQMLVPDTTTAAGLRWAEPRISRRTGQVITSRRTGQSIMSRRG